MRDVTRRCRPGRRIRRACTRDLPAPAEALHRRLLRHPRRPRRHQLHGRCRGEQRDRQGRRPRRARGARHRAGPRTERGTVARRTEDLDRRVARHRPRHPDRRRTRDRATDAGRHLLRRSRPASIAARALPGTSAEAHTGSCGALMRWHTRTAVVALVLSALALAGCSENSQATAGRTAFRRAPVQRRDA